MTERKRYYIEEGRYGQDWQRLDTAWSDPISFYDLDTNINEARQAEHHGGKYDHRVIDDEGRIYAQFTQPYEGVRVDVLSDAYLDAIQSDYGIDEISFRRAVERWLREHRETDG